MPRVTCVLDKESYEKIEKKASSFGVKTSAYLRRLVIANLKRDEETLTLTDIQKSIKAAIAGIIVTQCNLYHLDTKFFEKAVEFGLRRWEEEMQKSKVTKGAV